MYPAETCVRDFIKDGKSHDEIIHGMNALGIRFARGREFDRFVWCPVSLAMLCAKHGIAIPTRDGVAMEDSQLAAAPSPPASTYTMESRECAGGCGKSFRCLTTSPQKFCGTVCAADGELSTGGWRKQHADKKLAAEKKKIITHEELTAAPDEKLEVRVKKEGGGDGKALRALILKYPDRKPKEIADLAKAKGLKKSNGKPYDSSYVSAVKSALKDADSVASSEETRKPVPSESAVGGAGRRLPELAVAILTSPDLTDSDKVAMLRVCAGVPA